MLQGCHFIMSCHIIMSREKLHRLNVEIGFRCHWKEGVELFGQKYVVEPQEYNIHSSLEYSVPIIYQEMSFDIFHLADNPE